MSSHVPPDEVHSAGGGLWQRVSRRTLLFMLCVGMVIGMVVVLVVVSAFPSLIVPEDMNQDGELVILSGRDDSVGGQRQVLIDQWNALHPEYPARIEVLSGVADQQRNEMVKRAQAADSDIDIYNLDVTWTAEFAENGYISSLSGVSAEGFLDGPLGTCRYEKKLDGFPFSGEDLYALPFNTDAGLLYYRDPVPRPEAWYSMVSEYHRVRKESPDPALDAGYTTQLDNYEGLTVNVLETIRDLGGNIKVDEDGNLQLELHKVQAAVDRLRPRPDEDHPFVLPASVGYDEQRSTEAMRDGKVVYMRNWPLAYRHLVTDSGEQTASADRLFKVTPLPNGSILGGQNLALSRHSAEPTAATQLIEFLTSPSSQRLLFERGGFAATRQSVYADPSIQAAYPYAQELLKAVNSALPRPQGPCYWRFSEIFHTTITHALTGNPLPHNFIDRLNSALKCQPTDQDSTRQSGPPGP